MGIEYSIQFQAPDQASIEAVLGGFHLSKQPGTNPPVCEYRDEHAFEGIPDASVRIEPGGLYFCDHGGAGREFLGRLVAKLVSHFGPVTVADYE